MALKAGQPMGSSNELNFIGKGTYVEGQIIAESNLRVDGKIKGKVVTKNMLTVGSSGEIDGEIEAKDAVIGGIIKGKIKVHNKLELEARAQVLGDIQTSTLVIEQGAIFHGNSVMKKEGPAIEKPKSTDEKK
jgi:cytoskeletal protein CcmA (bactofilin family)